MNAIDIHLENFEGPLDLLMHLIKKNNLDIYDPRANFLRKFTKVCRNHWYIRIFYNC